MSKYDDIPFDHGLLNIPLAKRMKNFDAELDRYKAEQVKERRAESREVARRRAEARQAEAERVKLTCNDVAGAKTVRTRSGWHQVVRVNTKSVTVKTGYSWTDRIVLDKILEVRQ